jgi:hypothetical protein
MTLTMSSLLCDRFSACVASGTVRASEETGHKTSSRRQQIFSMRKCSLVKSTDEAEVYMVGSGCTTSSAHDTKVPCFRVQGSFWRRSCKIRNSNNEEVARIITKKARSTSESITLDEDVFGLYCHANCRLHNYHGFCCHYGPDLPEAIPPYKPLMRSL